MRIKLLRPTVTKDYIFQIGNKKKTYLTSIDYKDKATCLKQLQTVLVDLRDNDQIAIQIGNNQQYYFEITALAQSPSFLEIEEASEVLAELKAFANEGLNFSISFEKSSKQIVSKRKIGERKEAYNFDQKSISNQPGFELVNGKNAKEKYFLFNDAKGQPILYSRVYEGKTRRLKGINAIIRQTNTSKNVEVVKQNNCFFFIFKTAEGYEIARSKSFKSRGKMEAAMAYLTAEAPNYEGDFQLPKKKKKKRKASEKYRLKQVSPLGLIGFESFKSTKNNLHYFHYNDKKGQPILFSKPFDKRRIRDEYINKILKIRDKKKGYKTWEKSKNQFYFSVIDKQGKSFARSQYYPTQKKMLVALNEFKIQMANFEEKVNKEKVVKKQKYSITLPPKSIPEITKGLITEKEFPHSLKNPEINQDEKPAVLPDILPQSTIKIKQEVVDIEKLVEPEMAITNSLTESATPPPTSSPSKNENSISSTKIEAIQTPIAKKIIEEIPSKGFPWWWVLLGLLALVLFGYGLKQCNKIEPKVGPPPISKVEKPNPKPVEPTKLGPTALDLKLTPTTAEAKIADYLSNPTLTVPKTFILESVQFPFNSAALTATSHTQLDNVAKVLAEYPKAKIEINGHTDSRGEPSRNMELSQNRANAVHTYLMDKGISADRIYKAIGFGESNPISDNDSEEGMQKNRRSEIVVVER